MLRIETKFQNTYGSPYPPPSSPFFKKYLPASFLLSSLFPSFPPFLLPFFLPSSKCHQTGLNEMGDLEGAGPHSCQNPHTRGQKSGGPQIDHLEGNEIQGSSQSKRRYKYGKSEPQAKGLGIYSIGRRESFFLYYFFGVTTRLAGS